MIEEETKMPALATPPPSEFTGDEPDYPYEIVDGEYVEKPMSVLSTLVNRNLAFHLDTFVRTAKVGWVVEEMLFAMPNIGRSRRPDTAFVSYSQWPRNRRIPHIAAWDLRPEIAIEVVSPSNQAYDVALKLDEYLHEGVKEVWIVYPVQRRLDVFTAPNECRVLRSGDTLTCERFLPGFAVPLAELFLDSEPLDRPDDE